MSNEPTTPNIMAGEQILPVHRKYIMELLGEGIEAPTIAGYFIEVYPEYLDLAEQNDFSKSDLLKVLVRRVHDYRRSPDYTSEGISEKTQTRLSRILNPETLPNVIHHHFNPNVLEEVRKIIVSTIQNFEPSDDYDQHQKRAKNVVLLLSGIDNISYKRISLKHKLDKEIFVKMVLLQAEEDAKEDTGKVLPKTSTSPVERVFRRQKPVERKDEQE